MEDVKRSSSEQVPPPPTVFISYSHDSADHKMWVAGLATDLRRHGVDAILDQWSLRLGMDVPTFMENGIRNANRVCMICTPEYARKANAGKGGVGYEKIIVTGELYQDVGSEKFIPVLACGKDEDALPSFLAGRLYVDFRDPGKREEKLEELLRELHNVPASVKPPIGPRPFATQSASEPDVVSLSQPPSLPVAEIPTEGPESPEEAYGMAEDLLRKHDGIGWRKLVKTLRKSVDAGLGQWAQSISGIQLKTIKDFLPEVDRGVGLAMPLMAAAVASVESRVPEVSDQRGILDDFLNLSKWPTGHYKVVAEFPETLAYVFHYLHGAVAVHTRQPQLALAMGNMPVPDRTSSEHMPLWKHREMAGWPPSLGDTLDKGWDYLLGLPGRFPWLREVFVRETEWETSLVGYNLLLSALDLAETIKVFASKGSTLSQNQSGVSFDVPPVFLLSKSFHKGFALAFPDAATTDLVAQVGQVAPSALRESWQVWLTVMFGIMTKYYHLRPFPQFPNLP